MLSDTICMRRAFLQYGFACELLAGHDNIIFFHIICNRVNLQDLSDFESAMEQRVIGLLMVLNTHVDHEPYLKNQGFKMTLRHFIQSLNKGIYKE